LAIHPTEIATTKKGTAIKDNTFEAKNM